MYIPIELIGLICNFDSKLIYKFKNSCHYYNQKFHYLGKYIKYLVLNGKNIYDEHLQYLSNIHTLQLKSNTHITDEGLKYLP